MTRRHTSEHIQVYLACDASARLKNARRGDVDEEKLALAEIFHGAGWQTEELLEALANAQDFYLERLGLVKLDSWSRGHVTLVGDAAYCPSASTGMGTTSSIVGAYILATEIAKHCNTIGLNKVTESKTTRDGLAEALKAYDNTFRPFMDQVQRGISEDTGAGLPSSAFGIAVMNRLMGVASFLKLNIIGKWILKENVKGWDLPEHEEIWQESRQ